MRWPDSHRHLRISSQRYLQALEMHRLAPRGPTAYLLPRSAHATPSIQSFATTTVCVGTNAEFTLLGFSHSLITALHLVNHHE
jgi:hypothetical protein